MLNHLSLILFYKFKMLLFFYIIGHILFNIVPSGTGGRNIHVDIMIQLCTGNENIISKTHAASSFTIC